ncbi:MAG: lactate utilization protein [Clostridiales bacterium]|nr:lactate utilization protein [Clostridiales bacterium]MCD8367807.1 lactate utilization protein [Clostridiales bacterium]
MTPREQHNILTAAAVLAQLERHGMTGAYATNAAEALAQMRAFLQPGKTVSFGGSMTLEEIGFFPAAEASGCTLIDRRTAQSEEERQQIYQRAFGADVFFMSANAVTLDGKLVNVDGNGNRLAMLLFGPKRVVVVAGMNKVCRDEAAAIERIRQVAAPINALRLGRETPCAVTGRCGDCHSPDCICAQTVITRHCKPEGRIHVILVGEPLGY